MSKKIKKIVICLTLMFLSVTGVSVFASEVQTAPEDAFLIKDGDNPSTEVVITGIDVAKLKQGLNNDLSVLQFPETIDGRTVVGIDLNGKSLLDKTQYSNLKTSVEKIILPDTIRSMSEGMFASEDYDPAQLKEINIPISTKEIPVKFAYKTPLRKVYIPDGVESIGTYAFYFSNDPYDSGEVVNGMESITIPASVKSIGDYALGTTKMLRIVIEGNETVVGNLGGRSSTNAILHNFTRGVYLDKNKTRLFVDLKEFGHYSEEELESVVPDEQPVEMITKISWNMVENDYVMYADLTDVYSTTRGKAYVMGYTYTVPRSGGKTLRIYNHINFGDNYLPVDLDSLKTLKIIKFLDENGDEVLETVCRSSDTQVNFPVKEGYTGVWEKTEQEIMDVAEDITVNGFFKKLPTVQSSDIVLMKGDSFNNPLEGITATDADGNNITNIQIINNPVNVNKVGEYVVEYSATDQWGGVTTGTYKVTVNKIPGSDDEEELPDGQVPEENPDQNKPIIPLPPVSPNQPEINNPEITNPSDINKPIINKPDTTIDSQDSTQQNQLIIQKQNIREPSSVTTTVIESEQNNVEGSIGIIGDNEEQQNTSSNQSTSLGMQTSIEEEKKDSIWYWWIILLIILFILIIRKAIKKDKE